MTATRCFVLVLFTTAMFAATSQAQDYDLVILNGRVMDPETKFDGVRNVGIKGGRITKITDEEITGKKNIDATGHVVAPGFINTHSHAFDPFSDKIMARDGTTTILDTEMGVGNVAGFYDKFRGKAMLNYGVCVGHEPIRQVVLDGLDFDFVSDVPGPTYSGPGLVSRVDANRGGDGPVLPDLRSLRVIRDPMFAAADGGLDSHGVDASRSAPPARRNPDCRYSGHDSHGRRLSHARCGSRGNWVQQADHSARAFPGRFGLVAADGPGPVRSCRRLLIRSDAKLVEIALEVGYTDPANFGRAFRRWCGVSPKTYRRCLQS